MSVVCRSFRQNAWKKDLCSDCFRPENDHVDVCVSSNGSNLITATEWNGKVQAIQSTKVLTELRKQSNNGPDNGYNCNKIHTHGNNNANNNNNRKKPNPTPVPVNGSDISSDNSVTNGDIVNGKVAKLNQRNLDKSDDLFESVKMSSTKSNGTNCNGKPSVIQPNAVPPITKIVGILKIKSDSSDQSRKGSVQFLGDPIVIGYCDDEDSGNEESEEELDYCDYNGGEDDDDHSEEDTEFSRLTASNTRFNSIGANLRDSKLTQTFGQMNNQSNGIAFRIGDFKSETRRHDYDESLIGCNRVSELISEEKRGKLTNGSSTSPQPPPTTTVNGINGLSTSVVSMAKVASATLTTNGCNNQTNNYINNGKTLPDDELIVNDRMMVPSLNGQEESNNRVNGKQDHHEQVDGPEKCNGNQLNTINVDKSSSSPINSNVVNSSSADSSKVSPLNGSTASLPSQGKLSTISTNKLNTNSTNNPSTSPTITHNYDATVTSADDTETFINDASSSTINSTNGVTLNPKTSSKAKINNHNDTIKVSQQLNEPATPILSPTEIPTNSTSSIVTVVPLKSELITVNVSPSVKSKSIDHEITKGNEEMNSNRPSIISGNDKSSLVKTDHPDGQSDADSGVNMKSINESTNDKVVDEIVSFAINELSMIPVHYEVENELSSSDDHNEVNEKDGKSMNDEVESIDDLVDDIEDCSSSTIDITDATTTTILTSTDEDDKSDDNDYEVNDVVLKSSVSLTLTNPNPNGNDDDDDDDSDISEERSVESIDVFTSINNHNNLQSNQINGKVNSITVEIDEKIPKKPERSLKSSLRPKIPSKPLSLSQINKVNEEDTLYGNGIDTHLITSNDNCNNNESDYYRQTDSMVDQFVQSKSEFNATTWDQHNSNHHQHQSSRELRLAELAQELESVRHPGKRQALKPPSGSSSSSSSDSSTSSSTSSSIHEVYERPPRFNTITSRSNLSAPPPRPPPPTSGLKHIVNEVTNGYLGSNLFHSNGKDKEGSSGTKFSLKKLLKLSKDDNDLDHNSGESISSKIWKHKFDLDRRKSSPGHHLNDSDRSTSGSYEVSKSSFYSSGRERSYSLSGNSCLSQSQQQLLIQQQLKPSNGFRPIVPARRSRSSDINAQANFHKNNSSDSSTMNRYNQILSATSNGSSSNGKSTINGSSRLTISPGCSPTNGQNISSPPSPPSTSSSSSTSPLPRSTATLSISNPKLTSPSDLILTNLNLDSAYTVIAKYNVDTINRILHNYATAHQSYKSISKKDLFYESFRLIGSEAKIYKDAYLKSETISANFLVTPLAYSVRSEASYDLQYGQFIDSDENVKLFALKPEFDLIITLDRLLDEDFSELTGSLNLKSASFIILQFIGLLKYYQANGMDEISEEQLKLSMMCCSRKQLTNNTYLISPSFDHVSNVTTRDHSVSPSSSLSLCKCVKLLVKNLRRKLIKSDDLITYVEDILDEEKASTLSTAKTVCEMIFFEVPLNFESSGTLELWLDIQRTKFINLLNYENEMELLASKTVHNYYFMLFLTRSNIKLLFQCINQIRGRLLNQLY